MTHDNDLRSAVGAEESGREDLSSYGKKRQPGRSRVVIGILDLHPNTAPESDAVFNLFSSFLWLRIIPGSIFIDLAVYLDGVVAGKALPGTGGMSVAGFQILFLDCIRWEILISLDNDAIITLGYCDAIPGCLWHRLSSF